MLLLAAFFQSAHELVSELVWHLLRQYYQLPFPAAVRADYQRHVLSVLMDCGLYYVVNRDPVFRYSASPKGHAIIGDLRWAKGSESSV